MEKTNPHTLAMQLPPAERIVLTQELWDSVADDPDAWVLTDAQKQLLDKRLADHAANPHPGRPC